MSFKYGLLFILLIASVTSIAQEYEYVPFPTEGAVWKTDMWGSVGCHTSTGLCEQVSIGTGDEVVINDTTYIGIYGASPLTGLPSGSMVAAMRIEEDSLNKRVWIRATSGLYQQEVLLYDFNLQVGETLPFSSWSDYTASGDGTGPLPLIVAGIDTVVIGGQTRKRFHLLQEGLAFETKIIEGIGSTSGLGPRVEFWSFEHWWDLQCFLLNSEFVFGQQFEQGYVDYLQSNHPEYQYCQALTSIEDSENQLFDQVLVYPNPATGHISIELPTTEGLMSSISIMELTGKEIMSIETVALSSRIDINHLAPGMYLLTLLLDDGSVISTKIIKR